MNRLPDRIEAHCPRCSAPFVIALATQRKKLQCPNCRQTVLIEPQPKRPFESRPAVGEFAPPEPVHPPSTEPVALFPEPEFSAPEPPADPPPGDSVLRPGHTLRWLRRDALPAGDANEASEQQAILLHNLRAMGRRDLVLQSGHDDHPGQRLAERLSAIFREAGWNVSETHSANPPQRAHGLVLAAAQCPLPLAATATYMALKAAGFAITSRLDGTLGPEQSILIAGGAGGGSC